MINLMPATKDQTQKMVTEFLFYLRKFLEFYNCSEMKYLYLPPLLV
jgi:hypothetical protein